MARQIDLQLLALIYLTEEGGPGQQGVLIELLTLALTQGCRCPVRNERQSDAESCQGEELGGIEKRHSGVL